MIRAVGASRTDRLARADRLPLSRLVRRLVGAVYEKLNGHTSTLGRACKRVCGQIIQVSLGWVVGGTSVLRDDSFPRYTTMVINGLDTSTTSTTTTTMTTSDGGVYDGVEEDDSDVDDVNRNGDDDGNNGHIDDPSVGNAQSRSTAA